MNVFSKTLISGMALGLTAGAAQARTIEVTIENLSGTNGLYLTPFLAVFHDGTYTGFQVGTAASPELEDIAEEGIVGGEVARIDTLGIGARTAVATGQQGFGSVAGQPPVLDAGEATSFLIDLDPMANSYFSFLSMVIPSNDTFVGNANPLAYELFDANGEFTNLATILVDGDDVWDGGTEENDGLGAAFSAVGGTATDTVGGVVTSSPLDFLFGQPTVAGFTVDGADVGPALAAISFNEVVAPVPLPAGMALMLGGLGVLGFAGRRSQRAPMA
ncbi:spondin domain-containing protein [Tropicimonas sp. S265A]|uniref:spondin domain-containing protein n=1 Tax=Tropicimonas sp. S265A TaxID=3415134 RepID=UPI003C7C41A2